MQKIIAFTGMPMTGKSTARSLMQRLLEEKSIPYAYVHFGSTEEVARRDAEQDWSPEQSGWTQQEKEKYVREKWRAERGMGVMAEVKIDEIRADLDAGKIVLIDNMYSDEERHVLMDAFGKENLAIVTLAADWQVRVRRGSNRPERPLTEEELRTRDVAEIYNLHKGPTIAFADFTISNNYDEAADPDGAKAAIMAELRSRVLPTII